jgi:regulator of replication initiation timing
MDAENSRGAYFGKDLALAKMAITQRMAQVGNAEKRIGELEDELRILRMEYETLKDLYAESESMLRKERERSKLLVSVLTDISRAREMRESVGLMTSDGQNPVTPWAMSAGDMMRRASEALAKYQEEGE